MEPCEWPVSYVQCQDLVPASGEDGVALPPALAALTPEQREAIEAMAAEYLWRWTGRSLGMCPVQLRPCRQDCWQGRSTFGGVGAPFTPALINGLWLNIGCGICGDACSCTGTPALKLPGPVAEVVSVYVDGDELAPSSFRIDNGFLLVRQDGSAWPTCQAMDTPAGGPGTFVIDYLRGSPLPFGGQVATGLLAEQFAKAVCGDTSCALPRRVQSISRQGVTVAILDAFEDITKGHTGIWMIDSWVASMVNLPVPSRVYSPDLPNPPHRVQTWPTPSPLRT